MHLADAFIQSDLQYIQVIQFLVSTSYIRGEAGSYFIMKDYEQTLCFFIKTCNGGSISFLFSYLHEASIIKY